MLFVEKLEEVKYPQTRTGTLRCVRALAAHHFSAVISFLLNQQMPYNASVQRFIRALNYKYNCGGQGWRSMHPGHVQMVELV